MAMMLTTSTMSPPALEGVEEDELLSDCEDDLFFFSAPKTPSFMLDKLPGDDSFLEQLATLNVNYMVGDDMPDTYTRKYALTRRIWKMPHHTLLYFRKACNSALLKRAIESVAVLFLFLLPADILFSSRLYQYDKWAKQLNDLWEKLAVLLTPPLSDNPLEDACWLLMHLTNDRANYSLVTEADAFDLIEHFHRFLSSPSAFPLHTYKRITGNGLRKVKNEAQWFEDIMEVVDTLVPPPMLQADDYTRLLIKITREKPDPEWVLSKLNFELFPFSDEESPPRLKAHFEILVNKVINDVKQSIRHRITFVPRLFSHITGGGYDTHVSYEVLGLIEVADVRRIALGSRFIGRSHFLWAFYERGYVLPPQIRETIKFTSADENHPPYHIYLASLKLAGCFSEIVELENFIFCVISSGDLGLSLSADENARTEIMDRYLDFLGALNNHPSSQGVKRLRSGELKI